jgi:hypothetical protein
MSRLVELAVKEHGNTLIGTLKDVKTVVLPLRLILTVFSLSTTDIEVSELASTPIEAPFKSTVSVGGALKTVLYS